MNRQIDPLILQKLEAFRLRRRRLILIRGLCAALALLLGAMLLVALLDRLFLLSDGLRWGLSGAAYLLVAAVVWRSCVRLLLARPSHRALARQMERAEPHLREDLLSAVELGESMDQAALDSAQFRALVQSGVAGRMGSVEVVHLLPLRLLRGSLVAAALLALAVAAGFLVSGFSFGTMLARAFLPGANLERVSKFKVRILTPERPEGIVPCGEVVPLLIEVSGGEAASAALETFSPKGGRAMVPMKAQGRNRFSASIPVAREDVQYRLRAGDAVTRKYQLNARPRPAVVRFEKTLRFPAYSQMVPQTVREDDGDIAALEGSVVELRVEANQPVTGAEVRMEQGREKSTVALTPMEGRWLGASLPVTASGAYRVQMVGAQTGFESKFSPEYEIRAIADLAPEIELEQPAADGIAPLGEPVQVRGRAADDVGLAKVLLCVRLNEGPWKENVLAEAPGRSFLAASALEPGAVGARSKDLVAVKLAALDLKGQRTESRLLQLTVLANDATPQRLSRLEAHRALFKSVGALRAAAQAFEKAAADSRGAFVRAGTEEAARGEALRAGTAAVAEMGARIAETSQALRALLVGAEPAHEAFDIVLCGRQIARIDGGALQQGDAALKAAAKASATPGAAGAADLMREFAVAGSKVRELAMQLENLSRTLVAAEEADVIIEQAAMLQAEQERMAALVERAGGDPEALRNAAARLRVVAAQTRAFEDMLLAGCVEARVDGSFKRTASGVERARVAFEAQLAAGAEAAKLREGARMLARAGSGATGQLLELKRWFAGRPAEMVRNLIRDAGPAARQFELIAQDGVAPVRGGLAPEIRSLLWAGRMQGHTETLRAHGDMEEARPESDASFVGDVRTATLALEALEAAGDGAGPAAELARLAGGFRILEAVHNLVETRNGLNRLGAAERWEAYTPRSRTTSVRDWEWLAGRLPLLCEELERLGQDKAIHEPVEAARAVLLAIQQGDAVRALGEEMGRRARADHQPAGKAVEVAQVGEAVGQALALLRPLADQARGLVSEAAPKIQDLAKELAARAEDLKKKTEEQKAGHASGDPEQGTAAIAQAAAEQQKLNRAVDGLKDMLRAEANKQDVLNKEGRERARDADDALAMLREPPAKAEQALQAAANARQAAAREAALQQAAQSQQQLADALKQVEAHFQNAEDGKPEESRSSLRASEEKNGVKEQLDGQYAKAEQLEHLAEQSPRELLRELERSLASNPTMQKELSRIAGDTLAGAEQKLAQAARMEGEVAQGVAKQAAAEKTAAAEDAKGSDAIPAAAQPDSGRDAAAQSAAALAQAGQQQGPIAKNAEQAGVDLARAGRHEARLENRAAGERLQAVGSEVLKTASQEVLAAKLALAAAQKAGEAQGAVEAARNELANDLGRLQAAANSPSSDPAKSGQPQGGQPQGGEPQGGQPQGGEPQGGQPQGGQPQGGQPQGGQPQGGQPQGGQPQGGQPQGGQPQGGQPQGGQPQGGQSGMASGAPASPQEQLWMARTLDSLDIALNTPAAATVKVNEPASSGGTKSGSGPAPSEPGTSGSPSASGGQALAQAKADLAAAAEAVASSMKSSRSDADSQPNTGSDPKGQLADRSDNGAPTGTAHQPYQSPPPAGAAAGGEWGHLPRKVAEELSEGRQEAVAGEYRNEVEAYYRAVAEKARKP